MLRHKVLSPRGYRQLLNRINPHRALVIFSVDPMSATQAKVRHRTIYSVRLKTETLPVKVRADAVQDFRTVHVVVPGPRVKFEKTFVGHVLTFLRGFKKVSLS